MTFPFNPTPVTPTSMPKQNIHYALQVAKIKIDGGVGVSHSNREEEGEEEGGDEVDGERPVGDDTVEPHYADEDGDGEEEVDTLGEEGAPNEEAAVEGGLLEQGAVTHQHAAIHHHDIGEELPHKVTADHVEQVILSVPTHHHAEDEEVDEAGEKGDNQRPSKAQRCGIVLQLEVLRDEDADLIAFECQGTVHRRL